ncbi:hypothetical protein F4860DRAFT_530007 [Xylaria cubensis]|nr:hypothetical protein F4860DRAFT_530007 [Xylaria cubensis]
MPVLALTLNILLLLAPLAVAQQAQTVQDDWVFPQLPDYSTVLERDQNYTLKWTSNLKNWFSYFCSQCNTTQVDLWVTALDEGKEHKIASDVDVTSTLSLEWVATIPASELEAANVWSFQFVPKDVVPALNAQQISSPQFKLTDPAAASSTSSLASSTSSSISATRSTSMITSTSTEPSNTSSSSTAPTPSTPPPTTTSDSQQHESPGLSSGAKAGIGIGVSVGALGLVALGWALARRRRKSPTTTMPSQQNMVSPQSFASPHNFTTAQHFSAPQSTASTQHTVREPSPWDGTKVAHEVHGTPSVPHPPHQPPFPFQGGST